MMTDADVCWRILRGRSNRRRRCSKKELSVYLLYQYKSHTKVKYQRTKVRCGIQFNATYHAFNFSHFIESFACKKTCELSNAVRKKKEEKKSSALRARMYKERVCKKTYKLSMQCEKKIQKRKDLCIESSYIFYEEEEEAITLVATLVATLVCVRLC